MHPSHDGVLHDTESGKSLVFGFLTTERWWPRIQVGCQANGRRGSQSNAKKTSGSGVNPLALYHQCVQQCNLGEEVVSETVYINFTGGAKAAYEHYTASLAAQGASEKNNREAQGPPTDTTPITAWTFSNTEALDTNTVLTQAETLAGSSLFQPNYPGGINYIQLDAEIGLQNQEEMQAAVNRIQAKGFKTSIRVNPFCAALDSKLVRNHPDYCIQKQTKARGRKGQSRRSTARNGYEPATIHLPDTGKEVALLDVSHPEVQSRIREQIKHIVNGCGYSLINVDFTAYTTGLTNPFTELTMA